MFRLVTRIKNIWSETPGLDWLVAVLILVVHAGWWKAGGMPALFEGPTLDRRKDVYTTTASVAALVGGFATAAIAQYASSRGETIQAMRQRFGPSLRRNWSSILSSMLGIAGGCIILLLIDRGPKPGATAWAAEGLLLLGSLRSMRLVWLFNALIGVTDRDAIEPARSPAIRLAGEPPNEPLPGSSTHHP